MLEKPFPYQVVGARWLAPRAQAVLADDMGLGKSAQAILGADLVAARDILIVCPAAVRVNWEREFEKFSPMGRPCTILWTGKDRVPAGGVVIASYDWVTTNAHLLKTTAWDLLVLDEAHYLKERTAKRTRAVYGRGSRFPGLIASAKRCWRLTGTPAPNNASELWTHLFSAGATQEPFYDFMFRYCTGFQGSYGFQITGVKNAEELRALMAPVLLRRTKEEVMTELPPIRYQQVTVERRDVDLAAVFKERPPQEVQEEIKVADQTLRQALEAVAAGPKGAEAELGVLESMGLAMTTLRRYIGMAKLPAILDLIEEELAAKQVDKIVLFGVHQQVIEMATKRLAKFGSVCIYGKTQPQLRQRAIDAFQTDPKCRVFVGNVQAAGVGITLTAGCEVGFLEQDWVPASNAQAAMRCHRIGQTRPVRVRVFSLHKSVDEQVQAALVRKARELTKIF